MGLGLVEVLMDIEDAFQIEFPEDPPFGPTVGELTTFIQSQLRDRPQKTCYSAHCFYRLRNALHETSGISKRQIRPSTPLAVFFSANEEAPFCKRLHSYLGPESQLLPMYYCSVQRPRYLSSTLFVFFGVLSVGAFVWIHQLWWVCLPLAALWVLIAENIEFHFRDHSGSIFRKLGFPRRCRTVGDVALVMSSNLQPQDMNGASPLVTEVPKRLRAILANHTTIPPESILDTHHLVKDLGLD